MCDTCGIGPEYTGSGISLFGKNSDREPDETQLVVSVPSKHYGAKEDLRCTYISIPQVEATFSMVLSKPFWLWGAEMGVNEKGVVIGNEALFTKVKQEKSPGLIGMDLLRLALERGVDARQAAQIIIDLLEKYGQAGACGYRDKKFSYMNSFIIMDRACILKLETAGRDYVLKDTGTHAAISNGITIARDWDTSSLAPNTDFSKFSDPLITYFSGSAFRKGGNETAINQAKGKIGAGEVFAMLRAHHGDAPGKSFNRDVCMHAAGPLIRKSQTTGSMVVELHPNDKFRIFVTGGSAPCLTSFKPFLPAAPFPDTGIGAGHYDSDSYWWRHEAYHINAFLRYESVRDLARQYIRETEDKYVEKFPPHAWREADASLVAKSHSAFEESEEQEKIILERMKTIKKQALRPFAFFRTRIAGRCGVPIL
ncbi:MAG TPA: peptidase U34 [Deltaproteobacteria bacterium]|nr:peptidase U34 [Deltaproteobacteria bacterium]